MVGEIETKKAVLMFSIHILFLYFYFILFFCFKILDLLMAQS